MARHSGVWTLVVVALSVPGLCVEASGATIALGNQSAIPGFELANMPVTLFLEPGDQVASAQWDLVFDGAFLNLYVINAEPAAMIAGKSVSFSSLSPGTVRVLVTGLNMNVMPSGILATVIFTASSSAPSGGQEISLNNLVLADPYGMEVASTGVPGVLTLHVEALPVGRNAALGLSAAFGVILASGVLFLRREDRRPCSHKAWK